MGLALARSLIFAFLVVCGFLASHGARADGFNIVAFGLDGDQDVFRSEARGAAAAMARKYGHGGKVIVRFNTPGGGGAMSADLRAVLAQVGSLGDGRPLMLILTSHGSRAGMLVKSGAVTETLSPQDLEGMLDAAGIRQRLLIISACYSGVFADALASPQSLVITAADSNHTSFGCKAGNLWTYFGEAFFANAVPGASTLSAAFTRARDIVAARERAQNFPSSKPQMRGGEALLARLQEAPALPAAEAPSLPAPIACDLRPEPYDTIPACKVFYGYSGGARVGAFHTAPGVFVSAGGACPPTFPGGRLLAANKIAVGAKVMTLAPDCRSSTMT